MTQTLCTRLAYADSPAPVSIAAAMSSSAPSRLALLLLLLAPPLLLLLLLLLLLSLSLMALLLFPGEAASSATRPSCFAVLPTATSFNLSLPPSDISISSSCSSLSSTSSTSSTSSSLEGSDAAFALAAAAAACLLSFLVGGFSTASAVRGLNVVQKEEGGHVRGACWGRHLYTHSGRHPQWEPSAPGHSGYAAGACALSVV
eukprot:CAMPEP_0202421154 /NCGR_PEP_ID=MMETSP1128-20130828/50188_1 /ASSEMBLY_ACC=CAM_ASM_000463 /TAXON_ID=3047 /ORGANISM="Dunaliella tertiolecta, Strain CCMP1320" /LENGTH=201 /DNA_ID=CAMNT_0049029159 /DNA_START=348 /DNA_END=955 /DNA_ORIENTATION=+